MTREDKLKRIYEVIGYNKSIQDYTRRLSDYEWELKWIMIWDVLDWIDINSNWIDAWDWIKSRDLEAHRKLIVAIYNYFIGRHDEPIDSQDDNCITFIESLLPIKE